MDFSTLNIDRLRKCEVYKKPATYRLQQGCGNGCLGDPPGYPTYFTRSIYTQSGNGPPHTHKASMVITFEGVNYIVCGRNSDAYKSRPMKLPSTLLERLYSPLPVDHPRVRMWIESTYKHHQHCYNGHGEGMIIFPVPDYKLKAYQDDPKWKDEYREAHRFEVDAWNAQIRGEALLTCTPENHNAVRIIRQHYPDHMPELALIENPPADHVPMWWETEAKNPGPKRCTETQRHQGNSWKHPINGKWCQWCGWKAKEVKAV